MTNLEKKPLWQGLLLTLFSLLLLWGAIEALLSFLPVNRLTGSLPVNDDNPALRYIPNRTLQWSNYADFSLTNTVRINNYGFLNDQDYIEKHELPLVAVIGDSFIEAAMVPYDETYFGRLAKEYDGQIRIYSFGRSGAHLAQYLGYAEWVRKNFSPDKLVINIVGNDFDESFGSKGYFPGFHYFKGKSPRITLHRLNYEPGILSSFAQRSALFMYLFTNVQIQTLPAQLRQRSAMKTGEQSFSGQTESRYDEKRRTLGEEAINHFLAMLPIKSGLDPDKIYFVLDGVRPDLYSSTGLESAHHSFYEHMRKRLKQLAPTAGYHIIDTQPDLISDYQANRKPFEFPNDGHWNSHAHGVIADSIRNSTLFDGFDTKRSKQ